MAEVDKEELIRGLHYILAELHMALATNKMPDEDIMKMTEILERWWYATRKPD